MISVWFSRIVAKFEEIRDGALMEPEDTKEVTELMKFVEVAQTKTIIELKKNIKVSIFVLNIKQFNSLIFFNVFL